MSEKLFKVGFDIRDYKDILPDIDKYRQFDEVMNLNEDDLDKCVWKIETPAIITEDYMRTEFRRVMKSGFWFILKGMPVWLPPNYYFFLKYFNTGGGKPEFRLNRLMSVYEKIRVRNNPRALGTLTVKSRQIGETTIEMSDCLWEAAQMDYGMMGIQSKTRKTVLESCWRTLVMGWNDLPVWLKNLMYPEFVSGDKTAETMKFIKQRDELLGEEGKNVLIAYAASNHNAFDSVNNMRRCILDEWLKWEETSPYGTFLNYQKFMALGNSRRGVFCIFSSPMDKETKYIKETYDFWQGSDPSKLNEDGTTDTRVVRLYTNPLTGIETFYDQWGDADANRIYDHIMKGRKAVPKEYRMAEIRAYPLNEEEIFGSFEGGQIWDNHKGIVTRKLYIINHRFKDDRTQEPARIYGNLEWKDGVQDLDVVLRPSDKDHFDNIDARFCVAYPSRPDLEPLLYDANGKPMPPAVVNGCTGIDPIDKRYVTSSKGFSNAAIVHWKFRDIFDAGFSKCPTLAYSCRPSHAEIFFEDAIKAAVYTRSLVQTEAINSKIIDYFEDRGYLKWMLSKRGQRADSAIKGDSPSGKGMFLTEVMGLINAVTNTPLGTDDPYLLERFWIPELLEDLLKFNPKETHANDLSMAFGQSLLGAAKILHKKVRQPSDLNTAVLDFLLT